MTSDRASALAACLREARRLHNQTVRDAAEVDAWHKEADRLLASSPFDDPAERWDDPARVEHREFVDRLFDPTAHRRAWRTRRLFG